MLPHSELNPPCARPIIPVISHSVEVATSAYSRPHQQCPATRPTTDWASARWLNSTPAESPYLCTRWWVSLGPLCVVGKILSCLQSASIQAQWEDEGGDWEGVLLSELAQVSLSPGVRHLCGVVTHLNVAPQGGVSHQRPQLLV